MAHQERADSDKKHSKKQVWLDYNIDVKEIIKLDQDVIKLLFQIENRSSECFDKSTQINPILESNHNCGHGISVSNLSPMKSKGLTFKGRKSDVLREERDGKYIIRFQIHSDNKRQNWDPFEFVFERTDIKDVYHLSAVVIKHKKHKSGSRVDAMAADLCSRTFSLLNIFKK